MSKPTTEERRAVAEVTEDMAQREAHRLAAKAAYVKQRGDALYNAWLEGQREACREEAAEEYDEQLPPWTFERVAELRLKASCRGADHLARAVALLAAIHASAERAPAHTPTSGTQLTADGPRKLKAL